ncbi:DUF3102 domain-containing protein [Azospirillum lipoferum]|uniref:DUF3102 domain-containing protein n=1 Tax=Azospirillum lipoferum (strain 4B) TaxID=862719 RepID=G7ZBI0_AZOL4|nr:DUF3102 domain-containing protein [Azospirillum lipoferum]CBS88693.1 protein of unknown function [Azospirillum lipoferum 4B]
MSRSGSGPKHNPRPPARRSLGDARLSMLATPRPLTTRAEFAADIRREWSNALEATIAVGRRLNEAKAALPHGEYEAMVATDLPFSTSTARKLREIAAFVDEGQVPLDRLPEAMSTLYAIATLPNDTRQQALDAGTIHPAVTRGEVEALKVPAVTPPARPPAPPPPPRESRFAAALSLPWSTDPDDPGAITVELDGVRRYLLVMVAPDPAAADVVRHVVELHNAVLRGASDAA